MDYSLSDIQSALSMKANVLRDNPTEAERVMMGILDRLGIKYKFQSIRFQDVRRIFDFYLPKRKLIIEIDENQEARNKGLTEDNELTERVPRLKVIRVFSQDLLNHPDACMAKLCELIDPFTSSVSSLHSEPSDIDPQLNLI